jgi:hypothetical protein
MPIDPMAGCAAGEKDFAPMLQRIGVIADWIFGPSLKGRRGEVPQHRRGTRFESAGCCGGSQTGPFQERDAADDEDNDNKQSDCEDNSDLHDSLLLPEHPDYRKLLEIVARTPAMRKSLRMIDLVRPVNGDKTYNQVTNG